jgi:thioredoxin reductase
VRYDVIIIGAGPAGLSAALMLGRCGRSVLVLDDDQPRNGASRALHGFLTRDGIAPRALRARARADLKSYPSVRLRGIHVTHIRREPGGFRVALGSGKIELSRLLLFATGRVDPLPQVCGAAKYFGRGVFHCPYCDGWEHRGQALGVYGRQPGAFELADLLRTWSADVTVYTDGRLQRRTSAGRVGKFQVVVDRIVRLEGGRELKRVVLGDGTVRRCDALFFCTACAQRSPLPRQLGCQLDEEESVRCRGHRAVGVEGLYVAGNVRDGVHLAITAAAEGAEAAIAMNEELLDRKPET